MVKKFKEGNGLWIQPTWSNQGIYLCKRDYFIQESLNNNNSPCFLDRDYKPIQW